MDAPGDGRPDEGDMFDVREELSAEGALPFRARLVAPDRYGLLLIAIVTSIVASVALAGTRWERIVALVLAGATVLLALYTSRASRGLLRAAAVAVPTVVVAGAILHRFEGVNGGALVSAAVALLLVTMLVAVARRLGTHLTISWTTVFGAICVYLLFGMTFAAVYATAGHLSSPLFVQQESFDATDTLYYSFITLTTVGYGDLSMRADVTRILSAVEALFGQIYLIAAVGLLVGNLGRRRRRPPLGRQP